MKKIAIITSGLLPLPAVKDGAIETLLQYTLEYNEDIKKAEFDVYSTYDKNAKLTGDCYKNTKYLYIKVSKIINTINSFCLKVLRKLKIVKDPNFQLIYIKKVYKILKNKKYDYIIVESENHFTEYLLKRIKTPIILYLHNDKLNKETKNGKFIVEKTEKILVVSNYIKNRVLTLGEKYANKVLVIHNGIDTQEFLEVKRNDEYNNTINILFVGRIEKSKGTLELVKAFNNMKNKSSKLFIVGGTFHSTLRKNKYYKQVIKESYKRKDDIIFTGHIKHSELNEIYKFVDVQVVPSIWEEPAGLVNIEAIASGVKLIASNVGGISEYVDKDTILINKDKNFISNLSKAMDKIKKNNKSHIGFDVKYFSKEEYVKRYYKIIDNL